MKASANVVLTEAGDAIKWSITYAHLTRHFKFGVETEASVVIEEDDNTLPGATARGSGGGLPSDFFGVRNVTLRYTATSITGDLQVGDVAKTLTYMPYAQFQKLVSWYGPLPEYWSAKNTFTDGYLLIWPTPDEDAAADWTVTIDHDTPIGLPDADTDVIAAPDDFARVIIEGAKYHLLFERASDEPIRYRHQYAIFENMLARYSAHENARHGRRHGAWRIGEPS